MNIVIIGAGVVGKYVASLLSKEEHNVIIVDKNPALLEKVSWDTDVAVRHGSGTDWQLLDDLLELEPDFLIALTTNDETNFVSCAIAKHLGYPRTIARVKDNRFLNRTRLDFSHIFEVDDFVGPELLVANDILKYMISPGSLAVENFAHGAVQLRTLSVPMKWRKSSVPLSQLDLPQGVIVGLIRREPKHLKGPSGSAAQHVIFPHGQDTILPGDEVTFIGEADVIGELHHYLGVPSLKTKSVTIAGGSQTGQNLARLLEKRGIEVRLIEKDFERCRRLADVLPNTTIMNHDATDVDFLNAEKIGTSEIFVSCTSRDDTNLLTAVLGKAVGCQEVVAMLSNTSYFPYLAEYGINHAVSPSISAADHILSQVLGGAVTSLVSFYDNKAEIMEVNVSNESKVVGIPISELGPMLPQDFLIAMIQNRGRVMVAHGNRVISPGDSVIVITDPKHVRELEKIF